MKPDYGNWVPKRLLFVLLALVLIFTALLIGALAVGWACPWIVIAAILLVISAGFLCYMVILFHVFSFSGGGLMGRVHEYVANHLPWDGRGRLLDVGCGAGALTIRCAKMFPEAHCVGIDYWGIKWDYSQRMCRHNAVAEGVADHCTFQQGDANHLDFADGCFDAVVSNFVYHEIHDGKSREELLRETLRVLRPGGSFALQDLFGLKSAYGDFQGIITRLQADTVSEIHNADSATEIPIPTWLRVSGMMSGVGIIFGKNKIITISMTRSIKVTVLWLLTVCGFAAHSICDVLPMFWGKNMAVVATDGNVDQGMIVFMMTLSYLIPACGVLCMLTKTKAIKVINAVLAVLIGLFNIAHAFMELPSDNAGQYVIMPMMIIVGLMLAWYSIKYVKED